MTSSTIEHPDHFDIEQKAFSKTVFGFWVYLMTDCIVFALLFATYALLHDNTNGGPPASQLFSLSFALTETLILLTSSFTCGLAMLAAHSNAKNSVIAWFLVTAVLGASFLGMELTEFTHFVQEGNSWQLSAFLSSFFTLVGTHGLHITFGLLWIAVMIIQLLYRGLTLSSLRRITCLSMFWHFLDVIWIFIFTFVYLMGVIV